MGTKEAREKQRKKLSDGFSIEMNKKNNIISKPQKALFDMIKGYYPDAILNDSFNEINRIADISIPSLNIIIESDGSYFHKDKEKDDYRDILFNNIGWRVIRFRNMDSVNNLPFEEDIIEWIDSFYNGSDNVLIIE